MRRYETIFILRPSSGEEEINKFIENMTQIITDEQGTIIELNKWGMKKLAYLIKKESVGYYIYFDYAGTPAAVAEMERKSRIDDMVLKYMTVKTADAISAEEISAAITAASDKAAAELEANDDSEESENTENE